MIIKNNPLENKVAIVTGSSRNIGANIALCLAQNGANIVVNYLKNKDSAESVANKIIKMGRKAICVQADISCVKDVKKLFSKTQELMGNPDILINNSGLSLTKSISDTTESEFSDLIGTNIRGVFFATQEALKCMPEGGKIINIGSSVLKLLIPNFSLYALTKGAIESFTRAIASEAGAKKISVNMVSPGPTESDMFNDAHTKEEKDFLISQIAHGRIGSFEDISGAVLSLSLPSASWITGQHIYANGGFV